MSKFNSPGWKMKPSELSEFTLVTPVNRKRAVVIGRVLYVIDVHGKLIQYRGYFDIRPRLSKGRLVIKDHPHMNDQNVYIPEDESQESYAGSFKSLLDALIDKKKLYFKLTDKLINYEKIKT